MAGEPHPLLRTGVNVSKAVGRNRLVIAFANAAELAIYNMDDAQMITVGGRLYQKSPSLSGLPSSDPLLIIDGNGNRWRLVAGEVYLIPFFATLTVGANELLMLHPITLNVTLPQDLVGSFGYALNTATTTRVLPLKKNDTGSPIAEITFLSGVNEPIFEADEFVLVPGDFLTARGPSSEDATLANFGVTIVASR